MTTTEALEVEHAQLCEQEPEHSLSDCSVYGADDEGLFHRPLCICDAHHDPSEVSPDCQVHGLGWNVYVDGRADGNIGVPWDEATQTAAHYRARGHRVEVSKNLG